MKYIFSFVFAVVVAVLIVDTVSEGVLPDGLAVVTRVEGTALIFTGESPAGRVIRVDDSIAKNERVEVQENSRIEMRLPDGGYLRLSENSSITMRMLKFEKRARTMNVQVVLHAGKLWARLRKHASSESCVEVITHAALIAARDAVYSVGTGTEKDASTTISVYEGIVPAVRAAWETPHAGGQTIAPEEAQLVGVQSLRQVSAVPREGVAQPQEFDPKATINDWVRWNLQRDAREDLLSITVTPSASTITKGRSLQFTGVAHYPDNTEKDITWFATWSSSDGNIAPIGPSGIAAGTEIGAATITAGIDDVKGATPVNVTRDVLSIAVTPASKSIVNGAVQQFTAMGTFSDKTVKDITTSVVWRSSNTNIAFVDASGRVVAGNTTGTAVISASLGAKQGIVKLKVRRELVSIRIMPEGATILAHELQRFGAVGSYSDGTTQDLTESVYWESSDATTVEIDQAQAGRIIGKNKSGTAIITASLKGKTASGTVVVHTIPPH